MRRIAAFSLVPVFAFALSVFAQSKPTVPDVSGKNWKLVTEGPTKMSADGVSISGLTDKFYENETDNMCAQVYTRKDKEGDIFMLYGKCDDNGSGITMALRVNGQWYPAKEAGTDTLKGFVVRGTDGKPNGLKLSLDTVEGAKELVLSIS